MHYQLRVYTLCMYCELDLHIMPRIPINCRVLRVYVFQSVKITPQERLKKKMQALLNRQCELTANTLQLCVLKQTFASTDKADKKAEQLRIEKMEQQRQDREDEIREMSLKLRRK